MGMASSDDDGKIIAEWHDLQAHLASVHPSEAHAYSEMTDDEKAHYEATVRDNYARARARYRDDR